MFITLNSNSNGFCKTTMEHLKITKSQVTCKESVDLIGDTHENIQSTETPETTCPSHKNLLTSSSCATTNRFMYINFSSIEARGS